MAERKAGSAAHVHTSLEHSKQPSAAKRSETGKSEHSKGKTPARTTLLLFTAQWCKIPKLLSVSEIRILFLVCRNTRYSHLPSLFSLLERRQGQHSSALCDKRHVEATPPCLLMPEDPAPASTVLTLETKVKSGLRKICCAAG